MEPLKPDTKRKILLDRPQASPQDIEEYERLLAERFTEDPDMPKSPAKSRAATKREDRLGQLHRKLIENPVASRAPEASEPRAGKPPKLSEAISADSGPGGELPGEFILVVVKNDSNRNCTGGIVKLMNGDKTEIKEAHFPNIAPKKSYKVQVLMKNWPEFADATFWSNQGDGWAKIIKIPGGNPNISLSLD